MLIGQNNGASGFARGNKSKDLSSYTYNIEAGRGLHPPPTSFKNFPCISYLTGEQWKPEAIFYFVVVAELITHIALYLKKKLLIRNITLSKNGHFKARKCLEDIIESP